MNLLWFTIVLTISFVMIIDYNAHGQIDPLSEISFFQTGELETSEHKFLISDDFSIREFANGNIIRVSGQTIEGFPFITYSKIFEEQIDTQGVIFINNQFIKLSFIEKVSQIEEPVTKSDNISIAVQYNQRAHSEQIIFIDVKAFEKDQNKYSNFKQNYGLIPNTEIKVTISNEANQEIFSSEGITNDQGLFETKYLILENSKVETYTVTINAENGNSVSSKILQVFAQGNIPNNN